MYKQERLPLSIVLEAVTSKTSLEKEVIYKQRDSKKGYVFWSKPNCIRYWDERLAQIISNSTTDITA